MTTVQEHSEIIRKSKERIEQGRVICPPIYTDFRLHHMPQFFRRAVVKWAKENGYRNPGLSPTSWVERVTQQYAIEPWVWDHWGSAKLHGEQCFVLQPYGIGAKQLLACEAFANELRLKCRLHPASWWNPGSTLSIVFNQAGE